MVTIGISFKTEDITAQYFFIQSIRLHVVNCMVFMQTSLNL